jgi:hypothetical protein
MTGKYIKLDLDVHDLIWFRPTGADNLIPIFKNPFYPYYYKAHQHKGVVKSRVMAKLVIMNQFRGIVRIMSSELSSREWLQRNSLITLAQS